jgi:transcriptional regulator with XRE-family HTH domain
MDDPHLRQVTKILCMAGTRETPRSVELGARLREARTRANLSQQRLAELLGKRHSAISRIETGKAALSEADAGAILGLLRVTGAERDEMLQLARDAADPNWVAPGLDRQLAVLTEYERTATTIINVQPLLVPGLLQTADYARAIMIGAGATRGEADQRVMFRMGRRDVLTRQGAVDYVALIGEQALRYQPCDPAIAVEQLRHLERMAALPNVTIQAIPLASRYTPALEGPFVLIDSDRTRPVVHLEHYRSATTLTDARDVRDFQDAADSVRRDAMSPASTTELIAKLADDEMEHTT